LKHEAVLYSVESDIYFQFFKRSKKFQQSTSVSFSNCLELIYISRKEFPVCPILAWNTNVHAAIVEAITGFELRRLGWMGFENLEWVKELKAQYPAIEAIALNTSSILGARLPEVTQLFSFAASEDRPAIRSYFVAKLALEKLSCDRGGAGAGMCDKYSAFLQIFELTASLI
jgi:hypothetical protein